MTRDQATCEELATAWGQFLKSGGPGRPAFDSAQPDSTRLIGGAVTFVTEPAHDLAGHWIHSYWIHGSRRSTTPRPTRQHAERVRAGSRPKATPYLHQPTDHQTHSPRTGALP